MVVATYFALAAALLTSSLIVAAPTPAAEVAVAPRTNAKKAFTLNQKQNPKFIATNGTLSVIKTYRKFNAKLPAALEALVDSGSVTATPADSFDSQYIIPVDIGGQTLDLDLDTGSSDLWVFSSSLPSAQRSGHSYYTASKDSSFSKLSGSTWDIGYGDGSGASGTVGTTTVEVGEVTVTSQAVELATSVSASFVSDTGSDGLIGMGFSSINTVTPKKQSTFFDNALPDLEEPVFTADLKHSEPGSYDFGIIDSSKYSGDITYTDVDNSKGFWGFTATVDGTTVEGIADTGTSLFYLPNSIVESYWKGVSGATLDESQGGYTFSCSATLPDFSFEVEGTSFTIPGEYLNYGAISDSGSSCFGSLLSNDGIGFSIWGDILFKSLFVVFNGESPKLGFASKA